MQQGDAVPARPRDLEAQLLHLLDHALAVADQPSFDTLGDQRMCQLTQLHPALRCRHTLRHSQLLPSDHALIALRVLEVALSRRVVRVCQPVLCIDHRPEVVVDLPGLRPGRADVQRFASRQLDSWHHEMDFMVARVLVAHPQNVVLVRLQTGERHGLESIHDVLLLLGRDDFTRGEAQHPRLVLVLEAQAVDEALSRGGIASQHRWWRITGDFLLLRLSDCLLHAVADRAATTPLTSAGEPHDHCWPSCSWGASNLASLAVSRSISRC